VVEGLRKKKVMKVDSSFVLEPFEKRVEKGDRWAVVRTRQGSAKGDDYIEVVGEIKGQRTYYHWGWNKDMTRRFGQPRGVLQGMKESAANTQTGGILDKQEEEWGGGIYDLKVEVISNAVSRTVRIAGVTLTRRDKTHESFPYQTPKCFKRKWTG
jgi:hypothetical protein